MDGNSMHIALLGGGEADESEEHLDPLLRMRKL